MFSPETKHTSLNTPSHEREQRWKATSLVFMRAEDEQMEPADSAIEQSEEYIDRLTEKLLSLRARLIEACSLRDAPTEAVRLNEVNFILDALPQDRRLLARVALSQEGTTSQVERLSDRIPSDAISEILPLPRQPRVRQVTKERRNEAERVQEALASHGRLFFISASDSHRSTGSVFRALAASGALDPKRPRAVLSFDHHSDVAQSKIPFGKENVMASILENNLVQNVAVMGVQKSADLPSEGVAPKTTFYEGHRFYTDGKPSLVKFKDACRELFEAWNAAGIVDIYPSVDVDGLRIDELGYEGTDYAVSRMRRRAIIGLLSSLPTSELGPAESSAESADQLAAFDDAARRYRELHEYCGIPAAWIAYALEEAQRQGFHVGIRDEIHHCTVIGDVTELRQEDPRGRTTRIASALLDRMARIAQQGEAKEVGEG